MATQDLFIHQSLAAENPSFVVISEEDRKKKESEKHLLALAATLKDLEVEIAKAKTGASTAAADSKVVSLDTVNPGDNASYQSALVEMVLALQILQVEIAKFAQDKAKSDHLVSEAEIQAAQKTLKDIEDKIQKMQADEAHQKTIEFWTKFAEIAAAVIITGVALAFGQVEIAILVVAMTTASVSGGFQKLTDDIAKGLENIPGLSSEAAHIIAAVLILVVVIGVTALLAPATAAAQVADTTEEIVTTTEDAAETGEEVEAAAQDGEEAAQTASNTERFSTLSRVGRTIRDGFNYINPFTRLSARANLIIMNTAQTLPQLELGQNIADAIAKSQHLSDKDKQKWEEILTGIITGLSLLVGILSGVALGGGMSKAESAFDDSSAIGRLLNRLRALFTNSRPVTAIRAGLTTTRGMVATEGARQLLNSAASGLEVGNNVIELNRANLEIAMATDNGNIILQNEALEQNTEQALASQKNFADVMKQQSVGNQSINKLVAGEAGFAQLFTQYSPV